MTRPWKHWTSVSKLVSDFDIWHRTGSVPCSLLVATFHVGRRKKEGARNLTRTQGIPERGAAWPPIGRWIAYISDRTGEAELFITAQDGLGKEQQITSGYKGFKFNPVWSPDSKKLAWADKDLRLWYIDIGDKKKPVEVDRAKYAEIANYSWSPDSKWLSYDKQDENGNSARAVVLACR